MSAPLGLNDTFTEEGYWWVEGQEANKIAGTLSFDPVNGAVLNLLGITCDLESAFKGADSAYETIFGVTRKGKAVTLLRSMNAQRQLNMPGIPNETWKSNLLVSGLHLADEESEEVFSKSYVRFQGIEKWLGHDPFKQIYDHDEKSLTIKAVKPRESHFADLVDFTVTSVGNVYSNNEPGYRYALEAYSQLGIQPHTPKSLNWHLSRAVRLQELAALCAGNYLPLTSLELRGPNKPIGDAVRPAEVHLYARLMHPEEGINYKHYTPIVSGLELISFNSGAVQSWFDQYEIFSPAIYLFFTITGQRDMFTNIRLLLAIQALEVFHRRTTTDCVMPEHEFNRFRDALVKAIPKPGNLKMKEKLQNTWLYLNEMSLGQRLKAIVADITEAFNYAPPAFNKPNLRKLVDTRNYYTHFSKELEGKALVGGEMYWASRRIVLLLTLLFLRRLGVSTEDLMALLKRHEEFSRLWVTQGDPYGSQLT